MPALQQQSSDVRFREIDLSQVIRSRSSTTGAIIVVGKKGRTKDYVVTTAQEFTNEYGFPDASVSMTHYCALDALKEVSNLHVLRVVGAGALYSGLFLKDNGLGVSSLNPITGGVVDPDNIPWSSYITGAEVPLLVFTPKSGQGSYGNKIAIKITSQNLAQATAPSLSSSNSGGVLSNGTYQYRIAAVSEIGEGLASTASTVVIGGPTTTAKVSLSWSPVPSARGYYVYGRTSGSEFRLATLGADTTTWVDTGSAVADPAHPAITSPADLPTPTPQFTVEVYDTDVSVDDPREVWLSTLKDSTDGNGRQLEVTQQINAYSDYVNVESRVPALTVAVPVVKACPLTRLAGGDSGAAPTNGQIAQAWDTVYGDPEKNEVNLLINGGITDVTVQQYMIRTAEKRGDAIALLDTPSASQDSQDAITYRQLILNANSSYGAIYTSDVFEDDVYSGKKLYVPPSGWAAAVMARNDRVAGPQFSPAGLNRGVLDVLGMREEYNQQQRTNLFNAQVNYVRRFQGDGNVIMEASTLQSKASALSWISVRRMVNVLKTAIKQYLMFSLHEPNDDFTRRQIVSSLSDYLQYWKNARGLLDFLVVSDKTNNPDSKYNLGILTVTVFLTPIIPVHEIQVDVVITKAGVSFSEVNIANLG